MKSTIKAYGASLLVSSLAFSDYTGVVEDGYWSVQEDFGGTQVEVYVVDLYVTADNLDDVLLTVFNFQGNHPGGYYQSLTGAGWMPTNLGVPFETGALRNSDSFVTIGGFDLSSTEPPQQIPGAGSGTGLDPNFGGNGTGIPDDLAGWFNGDPISLNGQAQISGRLGGIRATLIGRFSFYEEFSLEGSSFTCAWNKGLGTPVSFGEFLIQEPDCPFDLPKCPDSDGDGVPDDWDECPADPNKVFPGICGCGTEDTDTDGDGAPDCFDNCPEDPDKIEPGICGCGNTDVDSDQDGVFDCDDGCPDDPDKTEPGFCGCGTVDTNVNGDVDCDGDYDIDDIRLGMTNFGIEEAEEDTCPADVDSDGSIGFSDVLIILNDWGACP